MKCVSLFSGVAGLELGLRRCIWLVCNLLFLANVLMFEVDAVRNCVQIFCKKQEFESEARAQTSGFLTEFRNGKLLEDSQDSWSEPIEAPWPSNKCYFQDNSHVKC